MKKIIIYSILIIGVLSLGAYSFWGRVIAPAYDYIEVKRASIIQEVSVTGKVKPVSSVLLGFNTSGKITQFNVDVGSNVSKGAILSYLDSSELQAQLRQAEASVRVEQARLSELKKGARGEEVSIKESQVRSADTSLQDAKKSLVDKIKDSYTKSDDSVRNRIDRMFDNPRSSEPKLNFILSDAELKSKIEFERFVVESMLNNWSASIAVLSTDKDLAVYTKEALSNLSDINSFLDKLSFAVNSLTPTAILPQTTIDNYKLETSTARTNINLASSNTIAAKEKLNNAYSSLAVAEDQLALTKSGTALEQITAQEARVDQTIASASGIKAQIDKTILRSPINGVVTQKNFEVGEIVSMNAPVVSIISNSEFEMEANVPEADIAKIKIGNSAKVTLDAYGSYVYFDASITKIDPAETMIEGVATYKTTLQFNTKDDRIKSGMTSNIDILTDKKENVLVIPQRSVKVVDTEKSVLVYVGSDSPEEKKVTTGLRGSDGMIEVLSGLEEGDKIVSIVE